MLGNGRAGIGGRCSREGVPVLCAPSLACGRCTFHQRESELPHQRKRSQVSFVIRVPSGRPLQSGLGAHTAHRTYLIFMPLCTAYGISGTLRTRLCSPEPPTRMNCLSPSEWSPPSCLSRPHMSAACANVSKLSSQNALLFLLYPASSPAQ